MISYRLSDISERLKPKQRWAWWMIADLQKPYEIVNEDADELVVKYRESEVSYDKETQVVFKRDNSNIIVIARSQSEYLIGCKIKIGTAEIGTLIRITPDGYFEVEADNGEEFQADPLNYNSKIKDETIEMWDRQ